ncbi:MAG: J domain-containing protein [Deltaproteobacteria bacterium]|nr:J domain-containing protein [Deltaproteobacteria bacterium]MBW2253134.1 J domain-containing protein [Deltaproteobacteria bacterium]
MPAAPSPYQVLGVDSDADEDAIKAAYRRLAKRCHPDKAGDAGITRFTEITRAYELLRNSRRRRFYDRFGNDPHELGLEGAAIDQALRAKLAGEGGMEETVSRADCPVCGGTGWRPSGRACDCDANRPPATRTADWDPTSSVSGRRDRMKRTKTQSRTKVRKN